MTRINSCLQTGTTLHSSKAYASKDGLLDGGDGDGGEEPRGIIINREFL